MKSQINKSQHTSYVRYIVRLVELGSLFAIKMNESPGSRFSKIAKVQFKGNEESSVNRSRVTCLSDTLGDSADALFRRRASPDFSSR